MTLKTPRLRLRPFVSADFDWLYPITASPTVTRYTDWGPNEPGATRAFLADVVRSGSGPDEFAWAITMLDDTGIGSAAVEVIDRQRRCASFGYCLAASVWGHGFATEAAMGLIDYAVTKMRRCRVQATCHPDNAASVRVLEKAGLTLEAHLSDHLFVRGAWRDSLLYAVEAPD